MMTFLFLVLMPETAVAGDGKDGRFIITCNWYYDNDYNVLKKCQSRQEAVGYIKKQPRSIRAEWYVYDAEADSIVYPEKVKTRSGQVLRAVDWVKAVANDSRHGYSCAGELTYRNLHLSSGRWGRYGDYSCSTLAVMMYELSGFAKIRASAARNLVKFIQIQGKERAGAAIPGISSVNLGSVLMATGRFSDVSAAYRSYGMAALKAGDILIPRNKTHVAIYTGHGLITEGRGNELRREYHPNPHPGDQLGGQELMNTGYHSGFYYVYRPVR